MRLLTLLVMALTLAVGGCSPPDSSLDTNATASDVPWMSGAIVTDRDILVAPNPQWIVDREKRLWGFAASSTLAISIQNRAEDDLELRFELVVGDPAGLHTRWNGDTMDQSWFETSDRELVVRIPAPALTPGTHALTLVRTDAAGLAGDAEALQFGGIRWTSGDAESELDPDKIHGYRYLSAFLLHGVTGSFSTERLGGVLFFGSGARRFSVPGPATGELRFRVQNSAHGPARFTLASGENTITVQVESHEKRDLSIVLDAESKEVELEVDGPPDGFYLWGAPHIIDGIEPTHPPIVLITVDTTRRDAVPPWSDRPELTPNLARFADHATAYARAATTSPWTLPSHASMLTGWYPSNHRAGVTDQEIGAHHPTVAELLAEIDIPSAGFAGGFLCGSRFGVARGFSVYHDPQDFEVRGDVLADLAIDVLDRLGPLHPFVFINFFDPHFTYQAPNEYRQLTGADSLTNQIVEGRLWRAVLDGDGNAWRRVNIDDVEFDGDALAAIEAEYLAEVAFMDHQIGRVFDALRQHGLYDSALIVVVADHGELLGEHRIIGHGGRLDPELVEVPLLVKFPQQQEPARVDELVSVVDVFPTLLHWAGVEPPPTDGRILPSAGMPTAKDRDLVFSEEHAMGIHELFGRLRVADHMYGLERARSREVVWIDGHECFATADGSWQPIECGPSDPMDVVNTQLDPPDLLAGQQVSGLDEGELEKLRALGYVQ